MVNLRQRAATTAKAPVKRTSSRAAESPSKAKKYKEINIDSDSDNIELEGDEEDSANGKDIVDDYASSSSDISIDSEDDEDEEEGSEDDKEIRRIIEKTEAETRNIPLTARQRAALEGGLPDPTATESKPETAISNEQALKNSEKSRRRKLQRDLKVEETKRATIDRLLQKQKKTPVATEVTNEAKDTIEQAKTPVDVLQPGMVRFIDRASESFLQFPDTATFTESFQVPTAAVKQSRGTCQICNKVQSKYTHPATGKLFCSLSCYKLIK